MDLDFSCSIIERRELAYGVVNYTASNDRFILSISRDKKGEIEGSCINTDDHMPNFCIARQDFAQYFEQLEKLHKVIITLH